MAAVIVSTYLPAAEAAELRARAAEADRSTSAEIRRAIRVYLRLRERASCSTVAPREAS